MIQNRGWTGCDFLKKNPIVLEKSPTDKLHLYATPLA